MVGINWVYAPVGDVNTDSRNPVIGVRSYGDDPHEVAKYATATFRGHLSSRVASTGKHFPGHGDTHIDSHLALPRILKSHSELVSTELVPFKELISAGIPSTMTGHMAEGGDTPCSLSRKITTELLKEEMQFQGVVVTDCLEMDAIAEPKQGGCGVREGAVRALEAGADVVMICHRFERQREAVEAVWEAVWEGRIGWDELRQSGRRVAGMKDVFCTVKEVKEEESVGEEEWERKWEEVRDKNRVLSEEAYLKSTTVVWNGNSGKNGDERNGGLALFTPALESVNKAVDSGEEDGVLRGPNGVRNTAGAHYLALARAVEERQVKVKHHVYAAGDSESEVAGTLGSAGAILFVLRNADQKRWQLEYLGRLRALVLQERITAPVVLVSSCGPYDLSGLEGEKYRDWTGYVATYEFTREALEGAVKVVLGTAKGAGKMPVSVI
ncbi:glycoside hydrolase superfamily [Gymnopilus junonius]|uniref:Glycoside hydrolase superfamily n=1 Tax=Gymnopilus junonius TaxID=109634 RepID=A0A9P5TF74_GYMJU|nr:glycoside hydrolase superfamily [Gymnopilus junonius]